jgi:hypothetical protein
MKLTEVFETLADGVAEEEQLRAENAPESAIDENWLPGLDVLRTIPVQFSL